MKFLISTYKILFVSLRDFEYCSASTSRNFKWTLISRFHNLWWKVVFVFNQSLTTATTKYYTVSYIMIFKNYLFKHALEEKYIGIDLFIIIKVKLLIFLYELKHPISFEFCVEENPESIWTRIVNPNWNSQQFKFMINTRPSESASALIISRNSSIIFSA